MLVLQDDLALPLPAQMFRFGSEAAMDATEDISQLSSREALNGRRNATLSTPARRLNDRPPQANFR